MTSLLQTLQKRILVEKAYWERTYRDWKQFPENPFAKKALKQKTGCSHLLCQYKSPILHHQNFKTRLQNIKLAVNSLDGITIEPNQIFSFFHLIGKPKKKLGYKLGLHFDQDRLIRSFEAGLGQLASVIYYLALLADLKILEHHSGKVSLEGFDFAYIPLGFEACITWGYRDLRFQNSFPFRIALQFHINHNELVTTMYGEKPEKISAVLSAETFSPLPFQTQTVPFTQYPQHTKGSVLVKGSEGCTVRLLRKIIQKDEMESSKTIAEHQYQAVDRMVLSKN